MVLKGWVMTGILPVNRLQLNIYDEMESPC